MEDGICCLHELGPGQRGRVYELRLDEDMKRRLEDMGFKSGTQIECVYRSPWKDPTAYFIKRALIALREADAKCIIVYRETEAERKIKKESS